MSDPYLHFQSATNAPAGTTEWGRLVWLANRELAGMDATVGYVEIAPGTGNPLHRHANCSEVLLLIKGELEHAVGDEWVNLVAGDVLVVPPGMDHGALNPGLAVARMVVVYDSGEREFEAVY
jgi:quercetin dioxygenase-like cupin family protein